MRLKRYLQEGVSLNIVKNMYSKVAKMSYSTLEYQLKSGWYEYVDRLRDAGKEDEMLKFINQTFHVNLKSLDDVNFHGLKVSLQPVDESIDFLSIYSIIAKMQEFIAVAGVSLTFWAVILLKSVISEKS